MPSGARRAGLALLVAALVTVPSVLEAAAPVRPATTYRDHVLEATSALDRFSATVSEADSLAELEQREPRLRGSVREFVEATGRLDRYRLADERLDAQRAGLARSGTLTGRELTTFLSAVLSGDAVALSRSESEARTRLAQFAAAARLDEES